MYTSPTVAPVSPNGNVLVIPDVLANELRVVVPNGGDTGGVSNNILNFDELIIAGKI